MSNRGLHSIKPYQIFITFSAVALASRVLFAFPSVIDWDESTFILMGHIVLEGHVPYKDFWDIKGPLSYFFYMLLDLFSLKSIFAFRIIGALLVGSIAYLSFLTVKQFVSTTQGVICGLLIIGMINITPGGMAVMTEIVALLPLVLGIYLISSLETVSQNGQKLFWGALAISVASLTRVNLIFPAVLLGFAVVTFLLYIGNWKLEKIWRSIAIFSLGAITPLILVVGYFAYHNALADLYTANVMASLSYAGEQLTLAESIVRYAKPIFMFPYILVCVPAIFSILLLVYRFFSSTYQMRWVVILYLLAFTGVLFSMLSGGAGLAHYAIQVTPFLAVLIVLSIASIKISILDRDAGSAAVFALACFLVILPTVQKAIELTFAEDRYNWTNWLTDSGKKIHYYLEPRLEDGDTAFLMELHFLYWSLDLLPPTKLLHPSAITKHYLLPHAGLEEPSPTGELRSIFQKQPKFIIKPVDPWYIQKGSPESKLLRDIIQKQYTLEQEIGPYQIYRRTDLSPESI